MLYSYIVLIKSKIIIVQRTRLRFRIKDSTSAARLQKMGWSDFREMLEYKAKAPGTLDEEVNESFLTRVLPPKEEPARKS